MDCATARERMERQALGALTPGERSDLDAHLATCADCRIEMSACEDLVDRIRASASVGRPSDGFSDHVASRVRAELRAFPTRRDAMRRRVVAASAAGILVAAAVAAWVLHRPGAAPATPASVAVPEKWRFAGAPSVASSSADRLVLSDGTLYLLTKDGSGSRVAAVDDATGTPRWRSEARSLGYLSTDGARVFCLSSAGTKRLDLVALDASSGKELWRYPQECARPATEACAATVVDGGRACWTAGGAVHLVDSATGKAVWTRPMPGEGLLSGPIVDGDAIYVAGSGGLHCLSAATGEESWSAGFCAPGRPNARPMVSVEGGMACVARPLGPVGAEVVCFDLAARHTRWWCRVDEVRHVLATRDAVYVRDASGVTALDSISGTRQWSLKAAGCGPLAVEGAFLRYVDGSEHGQLVALHRRTGEKIWKLPGFRSCNAFLRTGAATYVKTSDGTVHALALAGTGAF